MSNEKKDKVVRISERNYQLITSQGNYGDTFDGLLSKILDLYFEKRPKNKK